MSFVVTGASFECTSHYLRYLDTLLDLYCVASYAVNRKQVAMIAGFTRD